MQRLIVPISLIAVCVGIQIPALAVNGTCGDDFTPISAVQGSGMASPLVNTQVTVEGIVTGDFQGSDGLGGFFVQSATNEADRNNATSEGLFIAATTPDVRVGNRVRITGTVSEANNLTQLREVSLLTCAESVALPTPVTVRLPFDSAANNAEWYENMLVTLPQTLTVNDNFNLGRFGELAVGLGRLYIPTQVTWPGDPARTYKAANDRSRLVLDDGLNVQNPATIAYPPPGLTATNTVRAGDTVSGLTGVMTFAFNAYRIHPTVTPTFIPTNPRPAAPPAPQANHLRVASFNVLNFFNGDGQGGGFPTARGAENPSELARQTAKLVSALRALNADVIGMNELENDGFGPQSAIATLVNALNAAYGRPLYGYVDAGLPQVGTDAITVGFIYRTDRVGLVGRAAILDASVDPRFDTSRSRPAIAQTFRHLPTNEVLTVVTNHFKSKGSCPTSPSADPDPQGRNRDLGDGQSCWNYTRTLAAQALVNWLARKPTGTTDPDVLIIGDLNSYAKEDPVRVIEEAGYSNLLTQALGDRHHSYVFAGEAGALDHALANPALASQVARVQVWPINADEPNVLDYNENFKTVAQQTSLYDPGPYRSSDHDPLLVDLALSSTPPTISKTAFVQYLYSALYSRNGDRGGVSYWGGLLQNGQLTDGAAIEAFLIAPEFNTWIAPVGRVYRAVFGGTTDPRLFDQLVDAYRGGASLEAVATRLLNSPQFVARYGALSDSGLVGVVYFNTVQRSPSALERNRILAELATTKSRAQFVVEMAEMPAHQTSSLAEVRATAAHIAFTGRAPTEAQLTASRRQPLASVIDTVMASEHYVFRNLFTLQLLHASDQEAGGAAVEDAPRFSAILNALRAEYPTHTLVVSSGDNWLPGPFYSAGEDNRLTDLLGIPGVGRADMVMLNAMRFQVSCFGNHEFDQGPAAIANILRRQESAGRVYPGAMFPFLSANLDFSRDSSLASLVTADGQMASTIPGRIAKSTVVTVAGQRIGIVGATTPTLASISSPGPNIGIVPPDPTDFAALAAAIQPSVDQLTALGINKIVLLTHMQQLNVDYAIAPLLRDVDVIVAGGSHRILADQTDRLRVGDQAVGSYPVRFTSAGGDPIVVVNAASNYRYVGRLVGRFTANGILLADDLDPRLNGSYPTDDQGLIEVGGPKPDPTVQAVAHAVREVLIARESNLFGRTAVFLEGRTRFVRTEETNLGNLTADANLWVAQAMEPATAISLKNGGGIRDKIGEIYAPGGSTDEVLLLPPAAIPAAGKEEGQVSQFDVQNALRFNNGLSLVTVTARELQQIMEHGVAASGPNLTPGRFPQIAGMHFSFNPTLPAGSRVRSLVVLDSNGALPGVERDVIVRDGVLQGDPNRTFRIVTLNFLAGGGDAYPFPSFPTLNRRDLVVAGAPRTGVATFADDGSEQDAFAEYLAAMYPDEAPYAEAETPAIEDVRIQNLSLPGKVDTVLSSR